jgi:putative FmdB family regulatory protein
MPIYEYLCGSCKEKTEVIQGMNDPRLKVCPHCAGKLTKAFSAPAIQFKGSGFYITDYTRGASEGATKEADPKSEGGGSSEKSEKSEKAEKAEKAEKSEKAEKAENAGKSEKVEKKAEKKKEKKAAD